MLIISKDPVEISLNLSHISDSHNRHGEILLKECDVLFHTGDFCKIDFNVENFEQENLKITFDQATNFINWLSQYPANYKVITSGNHEMFLNDEELRKEFEGLCRDKGIIFKDDLHEIIEIEGLRIGGTGIYPAIANYMPQKHAYYLDSGAFSNIPSENIDIFLSHCAPQVSNNGFECWEFSAWLRSRIQEGCTIPFVLCGHIHEAQGSYELGGVTKVLNSSCILKPREIAL